MQAIILLGGKGTRLQSLYPDRPKALAPVAGQPFLEWQLAWLAGGGIADVHLAAGHLAGQLKEWMSATPWKGQLTISVESQALGTAGGLKFIASHVRSDPFLVLNGDSLLPRLDLRDLQTPAEAGVLLTLAVTRAPDSTRFGTVRYDDQLRVTDFLEKERASQGWVNGGVYRVSRALLERLPDTRPLSLEHDVFPRLCAERALAVHPVDPPLLDMGTPDGLSAMTAYLSTAGDNAFH